MIERRLERVRQTTDLTVKQLSLSELHRELQRRLANLRERRDALLEELDEINQELAQMEAGPGGGGSGGSDSQPRRRRGRGSNTVPLNQIIIDILRQGPRTKRELVDGALARGYKTASKDFSANVGSVLSGNDYFENRDGRWHYTETQESAESWTDDQEDDGPDTEVTTNQHQHVETFSRS